jgi:hypothetical protein
MWNALLRIAKGQQASSKIGPRISFEFENDRVRATFHPNFAPNNSFNAVVNLTADNTVMNAKGHKLEDAYFKMGMAEIQPDRKPRPREFLPPVDLGFACRTILALE